MNTMRYEKPALEFVSLRNENTVANTCWGHAGTSQILYCDIPGVGYMSFQIASGPCDLNLTNVQYHANQDSEGVVVFDGDPAYEALEQVLIKSGGSSGNPYKGEGTTVIVPDDPTNPELPSWS